MIETKRQLALMISMRDHVTIKEAKYMIEVAQQLINEQVEQETGYLSVVEDILNDYLGIELDYLFLFI